MGERSKRGHSGRGLAAGLGLASLALCTVPANAGPHHYLSESNSTELGSGDVGDGFGSLATVVGDLDADGYADVVVTAPDSDAGGSDAGRVFVFLGTPAGILVTPDASFTGSAPSEGLGTALAGAGDVNGDGHADVLLGDASGNLSVYLGNPSGLEGSASVVLAPPTSVAHGDVDGDGDDDVILGTWDAAEGNALEVHFGSPTGPSPTPDLVLDIRALVTGGAGVRSIGDFDADGFDDVILVGDSSVWVLPGSSEGLLATPIFKQVHYGEYYFDDAGGAGDMNGDGQADLWLRYHHPHSFDGNWYRVSVLGYPDEHLGTPYSTWTMSCSSCPDALRALGDVDGDGYDDLMVVDGAAELQPGGAGGFPGQVAISAAGVPFAGVGGSVDGDCTDDVLMGAGEESVQVLYGIPHGHLDLDGDGYGDPGPTAQCGDTVVDDATDCDDTAPEVHPGTNETCDGVDQDCDGVIDDIDADGDHYYDGACGGDDCDDTDHHTYPGARELCDGVDDDCDGDIDDNVDLDADGHLDAECGGDDCDDYAAGTYAGAPEICDDEDNDCGGVADDKDRDGDGYIDFACGGLDCDDSYTDIHPGAQDKDYDGIDRNCDGSDGVLEPPGGGRREDCGCSASPGLNPSGAGLAALALLGWTRRRGARSPG